MSDLITDDVVETATRANYDAMTYSGAWDELDADLQESGGERVYMRAALEEVAPLIAAKALEEAAKDLRRLDDGRTGGYYEAGRDIIRRLDARADRIGREGVR